MPHPALTRSEIAVSRPAAGAPLMLAIATSDGMLFLVEAASGKPARIQPVDISLSSTPQWVDVEPDSAARAVRICAPITLGGHQTRHACP